ncbi:MAG: hypothetical protein M3Y87_03835 [Myxococcota bacterium]|nr:hypothetical protein [Myxococcota bacterium]
MPLGEGRGRWPRDLLRFSGVDRLGPGAWLVRVIEDPMTGTGVLVVDRDRDRTLQGSPRGARGLGMLAVARWDAAR